MTMKEYMEKYLEILNQRRDMMDDIYKTHMSTIAYDANKGRGELHIAQHAITAIEYNTKCEVYDEVIKDINRFLEHIEEGEVI